MIDSIFVLLNQVCILLCLTPVQPHDGVQVFQLPVAPLVQRAVHHGVIIPGVNKQHLVLQFFALAFIEKPQGAGQTLGVKEVVAHADHHVHMAGLHQLPADITVFAGAVRGGGGHNKACTPMLVQVGIKVGYP